MKRDRQILENELYVALDKLSRYDKRQFIISRASSNLGKFMPKNKVVRILRKNILITSLDISELYLIAEFLNSSNFLEIDLDTFFTSEEMTLATTDNNIDEYVSSEVSFEGMKYNSNENKPQFIGWVDVKTIAKMAMAGVFSYNIATQRKANYITLRGVTYPVASESKKNIEEIKQEILRGKFEENTLTLNIESMDNDVFEYSDLSEKLTIYLDKTDLNEVDGHHRITGIVEAYKENQNITGMMGLIIKRMTTEQAKYFILQEAKGTINALKDMKSYDIDSNVYRLIKELNNNRLSTNIFSNSISIDVTTENTLVFYDIFSWVMDVAWGETLINLSSELELEEIKDFIIKFYSITYELIKRKHEANTLQDLLKTGLIESKFLSGFLFVAHTMYVKNNKQVDTGKLKYIVDKIDKDELERYVYIDGKNTRQKNEYVRNWLNLY